MEGGGFAAARSSIVRKEIGGALAWNRGHLPFNSFLKGKALYQFICEIGCTVVLTFQ